MEKEWGFVLPTALTVLLLFPSLTPHVLNARTPKHRGKIISYKDTNNTGGIMRTLKIDDIITVKHKQDTRLFKLYDIAVWKIDKTVKSIMIKQIEVPYEYPARPKKDQARLEKRLRNKSIATFTDGDKFIIKPFKMFSSTSSIYEINVRTWGNKDKITGVYFRKLLAT